MAANGFFIAKMTLMMVILICCSCQAAGASELVKSDKPRNTKPAPIGESFREQIAGNNQFAFDLYGNLKGSSENLFFSPFSISTALAMTYEGARGNTEKEMRDTLRFIEPKSGVRIAFNTLDIILRTQMEQAKLSDPKSAFKLEVANSIWAQKDFTWLPEFLDNLSVYFGVGIYTVDFITATEQARLAINRWVEEKTHDKIKDLIQPGVLTQLTRMVLVNAIYFYGQWEHEFKKEKTHDDTFNLLDGKTAAVPMMHHVENHRYMKGEMFEAVELAYRDCDVAMDIILPASGKFKEIESKLDASFLDDIVARLESKKIDLTMPKFKSEATFELNKTLAALGMPEAFTEYADFSGMDGRKDLFISNVIHKAFVAVDEKGTEAAAATAVVMTLSSAPIETDVIVLKIDRPFIYMLRDKASGSVLFLGRVVKLG